MSTCVDMSQSSSFHSPDYMLGWHCEPHYEKAKRAVIELAQRLIDQSENRGKTLYLIKPLLQPNAVEITVSASLDLQTQKYVVTTADDIATLVTFRNYAFIAKKDEAICLSSSRSRRCVIL